MCVCVCVCARVSRVRVRVRVRVVSVYVYVSVSVSVCVCVCVCTLIYKRYVCVHSYKQRISKIHILTQRSPWHTEAVEKAAERRRAEEVEGVYQVN